MMKKLEELEELERAVQQRAFEMCISWDLVDFLIKDVSIYAPPNKVYCTHQNCSLYCLTLSTLIVSEGFGGLDG